MLTRHFEPSHPEGPNAEQIRYWNEVAGTTWASLEPKISAQIRPFGERAMDASGMSPGHRVLDVGCGGGDTTVDIARRVGPSGAVTGLDISESMLSVADGKCAEAGLGNVQLVLGDAQIEPLPEARYDVVFSRFGVMFFGEPEAAFRNILRSMVPGGKLAFVCWRAPHENPWMWVPLMAAARHLPLPAQDPHAPGPFAFADRERTSRILDVAGFTGVDISPLDLPVSLGEARTLDEAVDFTLQIGPAARLLREADPSLRGPVRASIREALAPHVKPDGVSLAGAVWLVTARAPHDRAFQVS